MSLTLLAWLGLYVLFAFLAWQRPVWGVCLYFLSYFGDPMSWWWGIPAQGYSWNLVAAIIAMLSGIMHAGVPVLEEAGSDHKQRALHMVALLIALNATVVHFGFSASLDISERNYVLLLKFVLLYYLMVLCVRDRSDLKIVLMTLVLATGHLGYEVTFNNRGGGGRLEGIGPPTANESNALASMLVTILPLEGVLFLLAKGWRKAVVFVAVGLTVNVLLKCNSRGAFLGAGVSGIVLLVSAPSQVRMTILKLLLLGGVGTFSLMRDPQIVDRFSTTFESAENRDGSAAHRIDFWKAGIRMIADYPMGQGGDGFKKVHAKTYIDVSLLAVDTGNRAVHNGFINEACEWGVQGLLLKLALLLGACFLAYQAQRVSARSLDTEGALIGAALIGGFGGLACTSMFCDVLDNEWGIWLAALSGTFYRLYGSAFPVPSRFDDNESVVMSRSRGVSPVGSFL